MGIGQERCPETVSRGWWGAVFFKIYLAMPGLNCGMWDLVPDQGLSPGPGHWQPKSLSHWSRKSPWSEIIAEGAGAAGRLRERVTHGVKSAATPLMTSSGPEALNDL